MIIVNFQRDSAKEMAGWFLIEIKGGSSLVR
jgi:hypothetical protein